MLKSVIHSNGAGHVTFIGISNSSLCMTGGKPVGLLQCATSLNQFVAG